MQPDRRMGICIWFVIDEAISVGQKTCRGQLDMIVAKFRTRAKRNGIKVKSYWLFNSAVYWVVGGC